MRSYVLLTPATEEAVPVMRWKKPVMPQNQPQSQGERASLPLLCTLTTTQCVWLHAGQEDAVPVVRWKARVPEHLTPSEGSGSEEGEVSRDSSTGMYAYLCCRHGHHCCQGNHCCRGDRHSVSCLSPRARGCASGQLEASQTQERSCQGHRADGQVASRGRGSCRGGGGGGVQRSEGQHSAEVWDEVAARLCGAASSGTG